jgi:DNA polymerase III psi subunit
MALTQRQHAVLAEMGIPVWERREQPATLQTQATQPGSNTTLETQGNIEIVLKGRCVVVVPDLPLTDAEQNLLAAMLRTIALPVEQVDLVDDATYQRLRSESPESKIVWSIGASQQSPFYCDSLKRLLEEPQRKAMAWQVLKQLANQIK